MAERNLVFDIFARDRASNVFDKVGRESGKLAQGFGKMAGLIGGAFAGIQVAGFLKDAVAEAAEAEKIGRLTANAIAATGGAANITAEQVGRLSESLSNKTAMDDELIQSGANLLLTFKGIRNEAGKGNDVFNQATAAALDLSAAGFGSVESASVMLGKALNDPMKGLTALGRAGVQFTDQQKEQIKVLSESGDILGAQKIILGEIQGQVGGAAAASADPMARLTVVMGNLKETIGGALLPIVSEAATWFADRLPGALAAAGRGFAVVREFIQPAIDVIKSFIYTLTSGFSEDDVATGPEKFAFFVRDTLLPIVQKVGDFLVRNWKPVLIAVGVAFVALTSPVSLVIGALVLLYARFEVVRNVVAAVVGFITGTVVPGFIALAGIITEHLGKAVAWVQTMWPQISEAIGHVLNVVQAIISTFVDIVSALWDRFGSTILGMVKAVWGTISGVVNAAIDFIAAIIKTVLAVINGDWGKAWNGIKDAARAVWDAIFALIKGALQLIWEALKAIGPLLLDIWQAAWNAIKDAASAAWDWLYGRFKQGIEDTVAFVKALPGRIIESISNLGQMLWDWAVAAFVRLNLAAAEKVLELVEWAKGIPGQIIGAIGDLSQLLADKGRDIVQGLINGIKGMAGKLASFVTGFIKDNVPGPVAKVLGIASPSKLFASFGEDTVKGFNLGMARTAVDTLRVPGIAGASSGSGLPSLADVGAVGSSSDAVITELRAVREAISRLPKDYQLGQRSA